MIERLGQAGTQCLPGNHYVRLTGEETELRIESISTFTIMFLPTHHAGTHPGTWIWTPPGDGQPRLPEHLGCTVGFQVAPARALCGWDRRMSHDCKISDVMASREFNHLLMELLTVGIKSRMSLSPKSQEWLGILIPWGTLRAFGNLTCLMSHK